MAEHSNSDHFGGKRIRRSQRIERLRAQRTSKDLRNNNSPGSQEFTNTPPTSQSNKHSKPLSDPDHKCQGEPSGSRLPEDEWAGINDTRERKKRQNRLNRRAANARKRTEREIHIVSWGYKVRWQIEKVSVHSTSLSS